jgi:hypothetical protein
MPWKTILVKFFSGYLHKETQLHILLNKLHTDTLHAGTQYRLKGINIKAKVQSLLQFVNSRPENSCFVEQMTLTRTNYNLDESVCDRDKKIAIVIKSRFHILMTKCQCWINEFRHSKPSIAESNKSIKCDKSFRLCLSLLSNSATSVQKHQ